MSRMRTVIFHALAFVLFIAPAAPAAVIEIPSDGGDASGIGYFSGWKCPPNDNISIVVDGGTPIPVPNGVRRGDTAGGCGNDGRNGYLAQVNFNLFGEGFHTAVVRQNGVPFAQSTFHVSTFGVNFLAGAAGTFGLDDFPSPGQSATIQWVQGQQNFVIVDTGGDAAGYRSAVRFSNELVCGNVDFISTLSANGYKWSALSGTVSPYQVVTGRTSLGPFVENNSTGCGDINHGITLSIQSGHAYTLVQSYLAGVPSLTAHDDGIVQINGTAVELPNGETVDVAGAAAQTGSVVSPTATEAFSAR